MEKTKHPNESAEYTYSILVDGKLLNQTKVYDYAYNRALGLALYFKLEFVNTSSNLIMDKWKGENHTIIIHKVNLK
jgi:hypothetical protein